MLFTLKLNAYHHRSIVMHGEMTHAHLIVLRHDLLKQIASMTIEVNQ